MTRTTESVTLPDLFSFRVKVYVMSEGGAPCVRIEGGICMCSLVYTYDVETKPPFCVEGA